MAYVNPDSILTGSLSAIQAAASAFDRAEARRKEQEQLDLNRTAGEFVALNMPKFRDGKLVEESPDVKYNSPEFKKFANSKYVKPYLMEGVPEYIKDVEYLGMTKTGTREDGTPLYTPTARWLGDDGKEISRGPITVYRSKDPNDPVAQFTPDDLYNFGAAALYKQDPTLGRMAHGIVMDQARGGVVAAYRQAATPEDKAAILNSAAKYWKPSDITAAAAGPLRVENLQKGGYDVDDGNGNRSFVPDDQVKEKAKKVNLFQTDQEVERQKSLSEGRLAFEEGTKDRQLKLDADKITNQYETQLRNKLAHSEDELRLESARIVNNYVTNLGLDKQYAEEKRRLLTDKIVARVKATAGANYEAAPTNKKTNEVLNPVQAQDEEGLLKAREFFKAKPIEQVTQDDVLTQGKNLDRPGLLGLRAGLLARIERGDASAGRPLASVNALLNQSEGGGSKGEAPKPGEFNETGVKDWTADLPTDQKNQVRLRGRQLYEDASKVFPTVKGSQEDTDLNMAVGEALRENLPNHVLPLVNWTQLQKNPDYAAGAGSSREFIENIHTPVVELSKQRGLSLSPNALSGVERMAIGLKSRGIPDSDAVVTSIDLEKDPTRVDKIARLLPAGVSPAEREKVFLDILASDLKKDRTANAKRTLREGADYTFGGGMWR